MIANKELKKRIIEISYKNHLSHLGSCLTAVDLLEEIYQQKKAADPFILSCGHAGLALYCVIEKHGGLHAEKIFAHHGVHPDRCRACSVWASSGSLGHGLGIAVGLALADRTRDVYCLISDGETAEGSIAESVRIINQLALSNLSVYVNWNEWAAYQKTDTYAFPSLRNTLNIIHTSTADFPFLQGQDAHYHVMTEADYAQALEILK